MKLKLKAADVMHVRVPKQPKAARTSSYVVRSMVRKFVTDQGKRMSPSFMAWLNRKVILILEQQIRALGPVVKTLNGRDAEAVDTIGRK